MESSGFCGLSPPAPSPAPPERIETMMLPIFFLGFSSFALAKPTPHSRRSVTALSTDEVNGFTPYTQFARAAYCNPSATVNWSCGEACQANSDFVPYATGGDGDATQFCKCIIGYTNIARCEITNILGLCYQIMLDTGPIKTLRSLPTRVLTPQNCMLVTVFKSSVF